LLLLLLLLLRGVVAFVAQLLSRGFTARESASP